MVPPVRFLEQLMPAAHHGGPFVRAALPSRFAPQAFDIESRESLALRSGDDASERDEAHVVPPQRPRPSHDESARSTQTSQSPAARAVVSDPSLVHVTPVQRRADARQEPADSSVAAAPSSSHTTSLALPPTLQRRSAADVTAVPRERPPAGARNASGAVIPPRVANNSPVKTIGRPPLREHVREQRIGPSAVQQPTIVQVTIDRIDVRAPAANATPERTTSKPRNTSFKSLGDYLRQRDGASGGAP
jgi:hypothetical protein